MAGLATVSAGLFPESGQLHQSLGQLLAQAPADWADIVTPFAESEAGRMLCARIDERVAEGAIIYPAQVLHALALTRRDQVRMVILGQDPYHGPGQAHGLAFSVPPGVKPPPSLRNMFEEIKRDLGVMPRTKGDLSDWARRGVLLLNTTLTVEAGVAGSHAGWGWERLTAKIVEAVVAQTAPAVFALWGKHAQQFAPLVAAQPRHLLLQANHPSPLSARRPPVPFMGCGHFGQAKAFLDHQDLRGGWYW